jgi:DNA repair protein RadC
MAKRRCSTRPRAPRFRGPNDAAEFMQLVTCGAHHHGEFVIALNESDRLVGTASRDGGEQWPPLDPAQLVMIAAEVGACSLVLVTFVEDEHLAPTAADVARFEGLRVECAAQGVLLLDHLLMSGRRWRSVAEVSLSADPDASTSW